MISIRVVTMLCMALPVAAQNVIYYATGTFATPARGEDFGELAGEPFSIRILANENLKPTRQTDTSALYTRLSLEFAVSTGYLEYPLGFTASNLSLLLRLGGAGQPDMITIQFPTTIGPNQLTVSASVPLPPGTLTTTAIQPFSTPIDLAANNATVTYANSVAHTTLGIAVGKLYITPGPPPLGASTLYSFPNELAYNGPAGNLAVSTNGAIYGTIPYGGYLENGFVFELTHTPGTGWNESLLYKFSGGSDGGDPAAGVIIGNNGDLFGTTCGGGTANSGTVFELTPPATMGASWTETVLYSFTGGKTGPDGSCPFAPLVQYANGVLYGTTSSGGAANVGTVFQLAPPATPGSLWTETILYSFTGQSGQGALPESGLLIGSGGALFGATTGGTLFELTPPSLPGGAWTQTVITNSFGSYGALIPGPNGTLFGTAIDAISDEGAVFELTPPAVAGGAWTVTLLYTFPGAGNYSMGGVILGPDGALYGTTRYGGLAWGTVFKLTPPATPGGAWTATLPANFTYFNGAYPNGTLVKGPSGALYGTTEYGGDRGMYPGCCGAVFEFQP